MKVYKDKDPYVYNKSFHDKNKKNRHKKIISALMACQIFCSVITISTTVKYEFDHNNPFDGNKVVSSDFSANYKAMKARNLLEDEKIKDTVSYIKNAHLDETKAYILFYALISNVSVNERDIEELKNVIKYFCDNPYIDYEYVYNQLFNVKIVERNAIFPDTNISSTYSYSLNEQGDLSSPGVIRLGKESDLFHEMVMHGTSKNYVVSWIDEGYASIIDSEYNNHLEVYPVEANTIRFLCELIGKESGRDCFYKIHAGKYNENESTLDLLTSYLSAVGVSEKLCRELYDKMDEFSEFRAKKLSYEDLELTRDIRRSIVGILAKMYQEANYSNQNQNNIINEFPKIYLINILYEENINLASEKYYYFNKEKMREYPELVKINYYYPVNLCDKILEERKNSNYNFINGNRMVIDGECYVEVHESELYLCDDSKIAECRIKYDETGTYKFTRKNINSIFKLVDTKTDYGDIGTISEIYYNDNPTLK